MYTGESGRGLSVVMMVVLGAAGLLFTGLAVLSNMSHGRPWAMSVVAPVVTGIIVWLVLRTKTRRTNDSATTAKPSVAPGRDMVILGLSGLALMGLVVFLTSG